MLVGTVRWWPTRVSVGGLSTSNLGIQKFSHLDILITYEYLIGNIHGKFIYIVVDVDF